MSFLVKVKVGVKINDNIKVKGDGQECPSHTIKNQGLKPRVDCGALRGAEAPLFHGAARRAF